MVDEGILLRITCTNCKQDGHQAMVCESSGQGLALAVVAQNSRAGAATSPPDGGGESETRAVIL